MKEAMKAKDQIALGAIRGLKTAFMNVCVEKGLGPQGVLPEGEAIAVVRKQIKQRQDSVESFTTGGRPELAEKETAEIAVLEKYLPAALSAAEVDALVAAVIQEVGATSKKENVAAGATGAKSRRVLNGTLRKCGVLPSTELGLASRV